MLHVVRESTMHRSYCEKWGVTPEQLDSTVESAACTAYGAYIMDMGLQGTPVPTCLAVGPGIS